MPFTNQEQNTDYFLYLGCVLDYTQYKGYCTKKRNAQELCCKLHA